MCCVGCVDSVAGEHGRVDLGVSLREHLEVVELDSLLSEDSMKSLSLVADKCFFFRYYWDFSL